MWQEFEGSKISRKYSIFSLFLFKTGSHVDVLIVAGYLMLSPPLNIYICIFFLLADVSCLRLPHLGWHDELLMVSDSALGTGSGLHVQCDLAW